MDESKLARDSKSKGVVVIDNTSLAQYKKRKKIMREKNSHINELEERMKKVESLLETLLNQQK